jgi:hypothetical protein
VETLEDEERRQAALTVRCHASPLTGGHLTRVRQYDMAYSAPTEAIRLVLGPAGP